MCPALRQIQPNLVLQQFLGEPQWSGALKVLYLNATFATNIKIKEKTSSRKNCILPFDVTPTT
jgi:hypothetical protein